MTNTFTTNCPSGVLARATFKNLVLPKLKIDNRISGICEVKQIYSGYNTLQYVTISRASFFSVIFCIDIK